MVNAILYINLTMTDFHDLLNHSLKNNLDDIKNKLALNQVEFGSLKKPLTIEFYEKWLSNNYHGSMSYLHNHLALKKNPKLIESTLKSVISVSQAYFSYSKNRSIENTGASRTLRS